MVAYKNVFLHMGLFGAKKHSKICLRNFLLDTYKDKKAEYKSKNMFYNACFSLLQILKNKAITSLFYYLHLHPPDNSIPHKLTK